MSALAAGGVRGVARWVRRRVRLRTRLRRAGRAIRRAFPRWLPAWSEPAPAAMTAPGPGEIAITVGTAGALGRLPAATEPRTARTLRVEVSDWRAPYPGWSGRARPLPGLMHHEVRLPPGGRGRAAVSITLAEPVPVPEILAALRPVLEPGHPARAQPTAVAGAAVVVDATAANPRGRDRYGSRQPAGRLTLSVDAGRLRWEIARRPDGTVVVAGWAGQPLDEPQRAVLAGLRAVDYLVRPDPPPRDVAQVLAQLAMTGVVLHAPHPPDLLAPELATRLAEPLPGPAADPLAWEARSVRQRRAAIRHHAEGLARPPSVSALLVTKRPRLLAAALAGMTAQTYPELELVVGLHGGGELPPGVRPAGPVVQIPAERNLGEALAAATRAASGELVTKVDDDDRYGPEHIWDVVMAWHYAGATVAGKGADFVYLEPKDVTVRRRMGAEFYTDTVAGGTLTAARADLTAAGGWPPVPRWVDRALLDRVLAGGGLVYRTHPLGFVYTRHGDGHTWQADIEDFLVDPQRRWDGLPSDSEIGSV